MWMIYGKRTKEPYIDKQFRMLTAKGMRTTDSSKAMMLSRRRMPKHFLRKSKLARLIMTLSLKSARLANVYIYWRRLGI